MSEMLANQYFLARNYQNAIPLLRKVLDEEPENLKCLKKLIICYTQVDQVAEANECFLKVLEKDPYIIIDTDPMADDCPCPELTQKLEKGTVLEENLERHYNILGILYLYCDIHKSIRYFQESLAINPGQPPVKKALERLEKINKGQFHSLKVRS